VALCGTPSSLDQAESVRLLPKGTLMPPLVLATNTDPGTAFWVDAAIIGGGGVAPITGLTFVDATYSGATPPDGSIGAPHTTIQDALTAIGDAATTAEQFQGWRIMISGGFYDEDLVIPRRRSIFLDCQPNVILGDAFPPTTARKITWTQDLAPLGVVESYGLKIHNLIMFDGIELVSAAPAVAPNMSLQLSKISFIGGFGGTIPSIDATALTVGDGVVELHDCLLRDLGGTGFCFDAGATNRAYVSYANSCEFDSAMRSLAYGQMVNSTFSDDLTFTDQGSVGELDRPEGFFGCVFDNLAPHTWTMTVANFAQVDDVTWNTLSLNWTFVGAPIHTLSNAWTRGNSLAGTVAWAAGGDNTLSNALDRMASLLQTLNGGTPIP
jgi:hypothetical protein